MLNTPTMEGEAAIMISVFALMSTMIAMGILVFIKRKMDNQALIIEDNNKS